MEKESIILSMLVGFIQVMFVILKLFKVITWGWLWVLSPIWVIAIMFLGFVVIISLLFGGRI